MVVGVECAWPVFLFVSMPVLCYSMTYYTILYCTVLCYTCLDYLFNSPAAVNRGLVFFK